MIETAFFHYWRYNQPIRKPYLQEKWASHEGKLGELEFRNSHAVKFLYPVSQAESSSGVTNFLADLPEAGNEPSFYWLSPQVGPQQFNGRLDNGTKSTATKSNVTLHEIRSKFLISVWKMLKRVILLTAFEALKTELSQYSKPLSFFQC